MDPSTNNLLRIIRDIEDNEDNLRQLEDQIKTPISVIPFVGAGLSMPLGFPGWSNFLLAQAEKAGITDKIVARLDAGEYEEAAQELLVAREHRAFNDAIKNTFGSHRLPKGELKGAVSWLPRLTTGPVITTNFDQVLEKAFDQAGASFVKIVWGVKADLATEALQQNRRFLLKVHGDAEDSTERILTQGEYLDQYGSADGSEIDFSRPIPGLLQQMLISRPLLFLGCSLNNDRTVAVLKAVARNYRSIAHYAVVEQPVLPEEFHVRSKFLSGHNIRPIWYPPGHHELIVPLLSHLATIALRSNHLVASERHLRADEISPVTNSVSFETERKPRETELLRAVHTILASQDPKVSFRIPLKYDSRVRFLVEKIEALYVDFEALMKSHGGEVSAGDLNSVQASRTQARKQLSDLPQMLGLVVTRLAQSPLEGNDLAIAATASRLVELILTEVIMRLASFQFDSDPPILLEYIRARKYGGEIAHLDDVPIGKIVSYRIVFFGDDEERMFFAPIDYGGNTLLVYREFNVKGRGYIPPISFMSEYAFPQMVWRNWNEPDRWNIRWNCETVYVKDLEGKYLGLDGEPSQ